MPCPKCSGALVRESLCEIRCINCGKRIAVDAPTPDHRKEIELTHEERIIARIQREGAVLRSRFQSMDLIKAGDLGPELDRLVAEKKIAAWAKGVGHVYTLAGASDPRKAMEPRKAPQEKPPVVRKEAPPQEKPTPAPPPVKLAPAPVSKSSLASDLEFVIYVQECAAELLGAIRERQEIETKVFAMANACLSKISRDRESA